MAAELNHTIVPAHDPRASAQFLAGILGLPAGGALHPGDPARRQPGQVYASKNGHRGTYFRDPNGHLMEILTPVKGEPA